MTQSKQEMTYAQRAGMYLKAQLVLGKQAADKDAKKGYRERFAAKIGVEPRTLCRYCVEIHDVDTIAYIADALGVSVRDMLFYDEEDIPFFVTECGSDLRLTNAYNRFANAPSWMRYELKEMFEMNLII